MKLSLDEEIKKISDEINTENEDFKGVSVEEMTNLRPGFDVKTVELRPEKELNFEIPKTKKKTKRKKKNRNVDLHARFTQEEAEKIREDREKVGMKPGEYMRHRMLADVDFVVIERDLIAENTKEVILLKAEIGKIGGILKSCIKPNEGNPHLTEEDLAQIKSAVNSLEQLKGQIQRAVNKKWQS